MAQLLPMSEEMIASFGSAAWMAHRLKFKKHLDDRYRAGDDGLVSIDTALERLARQHERPAVATRLLLGLMALVGIVQIIVEWRDPLPMATVGNDGLDYVAHLRNKGISTEFIRELTDTYTAGGEVLMGALRWEKERADRAANEVNEVAGRLKRVRLDAEEAELEVRVKSLQTELLAKQVEKELLVRTTESRKGELSRGLTRMEELRGADAAKPGRK